MTAFHPFYIRPCRMVDEHNVEETTPELAEFWGLYKQINDGRRMWESDHPDEGDARWHQMIRFIRG